MVETVSASTLPQGTGPGSAARQLEPGTELKARVESNLPGGVVRLATADGKVDLRVAAPLPTDAEVTVTVSGSKQQPTILITTDRGSGQPAPQPANPAPGPSSPAPQPAPAGGSTPQAAPPLSSGAGPTFVGAKPAGAHLVQVLSASAVPAAGSGPAALPATSSGPVPPQVSPGQGPVLTQSLPGQGTGGLAPLPNSTGPQPAGPLPGAAQPAAPSVSGAAGGSVVPSGPAQSGPTQNGPAQTGAGGAQAQASGTPLGPQTVQGPATGTPPVAGSSLPVPAAGQQASPQPATLPAGQALGAAGSAGAAQTGTAAGPFLGTGATATSGQGFTGPAGLAGSPPASAPGALSRGGQVPTAPGLQSGGPQGQGAPAQPAGVQAGPGGPVASGPAASPPSGAVAPQPASSVSNPLPQAAPPAPSAPAGTSIPLSGAGAQQPGVPAGAAPAAGSQQAGPSAPAAPAPQASSTPAPGTALPTAQGRGAGAALATLSAGTAGLGQQQGAPPVRILSGQPYQQLGQQALGGAAGTATGTPVANTGSGPVAELAGALRQPLSEQQAGLTSLFAQVGSLTSAQSAGAVTLPDAVAKAMQQILGLRLNLTGGTTAGDLQQAVRQSGQFREAHLGLPGGGASAVPDLKSALLSFKALLQQLGARPEITRPAGQPAAPSRQGAPQGQAPQAASGYWAGAAPQNLQALLKETDAALARLRLTQLSNAGLARDVAPQAMAKPMDLVLELPLSFGQETAVMQMQIGRDGAGNQSEQDGEPAWRLRFALDLTATGPLEAAISLRGGGTYASLWIDRKDTFDNLTAVRDTMEAAFADAGLDLQELRLIRGLPPKTAAYYGAMVDRQS